MGPREIDRERLLDGALGITGAHHEDGVARTHPPKRAERALRGEGEPVRVATRRELPFPLGLELAQLCEIGRPINGRPCERSHQLGYSVLRVGDDAHIRRVVLANLMWVYVDVDQARRWDREGNPLRIARRGPVCESAPDCDDHVRTASDLVAARRARLANAPSEQLVIL